MTALSPVTLASVLDQSVDCVKLVGLDGLVQYMNANGLCSMEFDDVGQVQGRRWIDLWPAEGQDLVREAIPRAATGDTVRFRSYCPTAKGTPRWWDVTVSPVFNADHLHAGYLAVSRDVTENQLSREALEVAAAEMKHRLKNTYTMVISLLRGYARGNRENEEFAHIMGERLRALSVAQALFLTDEAPCELDLLVPALLSPFSSSICPVKINEIRAILVDRGQADAIALIVGELAVNSAKHGALGHGGTIDVSSATEGQRLTLIWSERCDKPVKAHSRDGGQGLRLMERIVKARRGSIETEWHLHGVVVRITFTLEPVAI